MPCDFELRKKRVRNCVSLLPNAAPFGRAWHWAGCSWPALAGTGLAQIPSAIYVMKPDGTSVRKITQAPDFKNVGHPRWSHDGKQLAFHAWAGPAANVRRVFVVNGDGTQLREAGADGQFPDWSPDDKQLAFQMRDANANQINTFVQNLDGNGRTLLFEGTSPRWSHDGSQLAFIEKSGELIVRDLVDDSEHSLLDDNSDDVQGGFDLSADGTQIAFVAKRDRKAALWITETKNPRPRLRLQGNLMGQVAWSPDGKQLAITLDGAIRLLNTDDSKPPQLIPGQIGKSRDPAWSPDGKWLAFASNRNTDGP